MKISAKMAAALDEQITAELQAATIYRQLSIEVAVMGFNGMSSWLNTHAEEEIGHADQFIQHVISRDGHPRIGSIEMGDIQVSSVEEVFAMALEHEEKISNAIRDLYRLALAEDDLDSLPLMHSFLAEQVEEEDSVGNIIKRLELAKGESHAQLRLDDELKG